MVLGEIVSHLLSRPSSPGGMGFIMTMITASAGIFGAGGGVFALIQIASLWKLFEKAGEPPWHAVVPILNLLTLLKILGKPPTLLLLLIVCCIGWIALKVILDLALAERFGQSSGFAIGLIFVPIIFLPMLAFGSSTYSKPPAAA
jgi:hypothetical protein